MSNLGLRHLHERRRSTTGCEPYPATGFRRGYDYLMYGVGLVMPVALLPQVIAVYVTHDTAGVSIATWLLLTVFNILWAVYGLLHRDVPITLANTLLTVFDLAIVFGVLFS